LFLQDWRPWPLLLHPPPPPVSQCSGDLRWLPSLTVEVSIIHAFRFALHTIYCIGDLVLCAVRVYLLCVSVSLCFRFHLVREEKESVFEYLLFA
jgi:hypothetical protein